MPREKEARRPIFRVNEAESAGPVDIIVTEFNASLNADRPVNKFDGSKADILLRSRIFGSSTEPSTSNWIA